MCIKKTIKQLIAMFILVILIVGNVPYSANAQEAKQCVYTKEGYEIIYSVISSWNGSRNINVTISNIGNEDIRGWAVTFVTRGEIYNIWNACVVECNCEGYTDSNTEYLIQSESYNGCIPVGAAVSFGYQEKTNSEEFPLDMNLISYKEALPEDTYDVSLNINSDWGNGVTGEIVLRNTGEYELYFWELGFDTNVCVNDFWNARMINQSIDGFYLLQACDDTAIIMPKREVRIGFIASKSVDVQTMIENVYLFHTSIWKAEFDKETSDKEVDVPDELEEQKYNEIVFYERISEVMQHYDETTYDIDTDEDGLKDCEEKIVGTDLNVIDTDGDSLSDYDEIYKTYTNPLVFDSEVPGCSDGELDSDEDGIFNLTEIQLGTNPLSADTDEDGISDDEEINLYGTNPILLDTDFDGIEDLHELMLGLNPTKKDSDDDGIEDSDVMFAQESEVVFENNEFISKVHVAAEAGNLFSEVTFIDEVPQCLNYDFEKVGVLGNPIEINTYSNIDSAQISFYLCDMYNVEDYVVIWYDDKNSRFVECDTECNRADGIVSVNTTHFSVYFLASKEKWNRALEEYYKNVKAEFETVIVVDCSESMSASDPNYVEFTYGFRQSTHRKDVCEAFIRKISDNNKQGIVFFNNNGTVLCKLGSTSAQLSDTLGMICNSYNTNIRTALGVALDELLTSKNKDAMKSIVLISDGGTEYSGDILGYDTEVLKRAKKENVRIYTVAVGDNAVIKNLEEIAEVTDGIALTYSFNNASVIVDKIFGDQAFHKYISVTPSAWLKSEEILGTKAYLKKLEGRVWQCIPYLISTNDQVCSVKRKLMMEDYYNFVKCCDPKDIPDTIWDSYCTEFNKAVRGSCEGLDKDIHYFRNNLNRAPATRDKLIADKDNWKLLPISMSLYHIYGEDGVFNTKFISRVDGKYEAVYNKEGILLTEKNDCDNMGTYNYSSSSVNVVLHLFLDMMPFYKWGNVEGGSPRPKRDIDDFNDNQEARDAYDKIQELMQTN